MVKFPVGLYTDVRIEETFDTRISYKKEELQEQKIRNNKGAFIRVFDGNRWYYSSTTDVNGIQEKIDILASMATPNDEIHDHPYVKKIEVNQDVRMQYQDNPIHQIDVSKKDAVLRDFLALLEDPTIVHFNGFYVDNLTIKEIFNSKGTHVKFDKQTCGIGISMQMVSGDNKDRLSVSSSAITLEELMTKKDLCAKEVQKDIDYVKHAETFDAGEYPVLMSPLATGVFTHESFGHKSESDFMVGDEAMRKEWQLGKVIGKPLLNIIDDGTVKGNGYVPYDDEGTLGKKTMIITEGKLTGRLHSVATSAALEEPLTGNARSINFEFEPIVRMTTTYINKGKTPLDEIIKSIDYGVFIDTIKHGSGMSTFTIAPSRAYKIENGKITKPIKLSVVTGNVFETLTLVDQVSEEFELLSFVGGGCGKMEQFPLPVGFGGPYTLVRKLKVQ